MEQAATATLNDILSKDTWTFEDHQELMARYFEVPEATDKLRAALGEIERANPEPKGTAALKIGIGRYMLCRFAGALEALSDATDNRDRRFFQGLCHKALGSYCRAVEELQRAKSKGGDAPELDVALVEALALSGQWDDARKTLKDARGKMNADDAEYLEGLILEVSGEADKAMEVFQQVLDRNEKHAPAAYRMAYFLDLHGEEEEAVRLYLSCLDSPPVYAHALINLAVLYEDAGQYDDAADCLHRLLKCNPNHARAELFLKDVEASKTMYFDEEQAKRVAKRNAVLDIPVTDFELSVRARNCLKKMNIRTLGDLVRTTEAELLAYKNFGETSLKEIKDMLAAKGLRLGQAIDEGLDFLTSEPGPAAISAPPQEGAAATPIDQVDWSMRARRALDSLGIRTMGDLAQKTEAELMSCKNFGQTSLNEIHQRLSEAGLSLRGKS